LEAALSLRKCLLREVATSGRRLFRRLVCLSESGCSERWPRPAKGCFGGCSVSQKVFAQRGGHVRQKVVSEAVLSLRKCLLREVATSGRRLFRRLFCLSESGCSERWPRPAEGCFGGCSVSQKVFAQRGGHVRQKVVSEAALSLRKCCSERWPRPAEGSFRDCSVSQKVFAQRGGNVRQKVVSEGCSVFQKVFAQRGGHIR